MKIKILFDTTPINNNLRSGWGFSGLVDDKILFDTGENGNWLKNNIEILKVDINKITAVVISHDHQDHTGGLWKFLESQKKISVYGCPGFSRAFKEKVEKMSGLLEETKKVTEISENIFVTGEIKGEYRGRAMPEQALITRTKNGISIITGCAHPGILKITETVKNSFPDEKLYLVMGGFHLIETDKRIISIIVSEFKKMGVKKAGPTHCSGKQAEEIFKMRYGRNFLSVKVGTTFEV